MCFFVGTYTELFPPPPGACVCTGQAQYTSDCTEVVPALAHRKYVSITVLKKMRNAKGFMAGLLKNVWPNHLC